MVPKNRLRLFSVCLAPQNRIPVAVRMTFSTKMPFPWRWGAHFSKTCHLPIYAPCKKCSGSSGGGHFCTCRNWPLQKVPPVHVNVFFFKIAVLSTSKNFKLILWVAKSACGATPVPSFRPLAPDRSLHCRSSSATTLASSTKPHSSIRVIFALLSKITFGHLL